MVAPSGAVTTTETILAPTLKAIAPEGLPEVTAVPFTVTVAFTSDVAGVTVNEVTPFATLTV